MRSLQIRCFFQKLFRNLDLATWRFFPLAKEFLMEKWSLYVEKNPSNGRNFDSHVKIKFWDRILRDLEEICPYLTFFHFRTVLSFLTRKNLQAALNQDSEKSFWKNLTFEEISSRSQNPVSELNFDIWIKIYRASKFFPSLKSEISDFCTVWEPKTVGKWKRAVKRLGHIPKNINFFFGFQIV